MAKPPTTVYLDPAAIPRGQTGVVAATPEEAADIIRGNVPAPAPVPSTVPPVPVPAPKAKVPSVPTPEPVLTPAQEQRQQEEIRRLVERSTVELDTGERVSKPEFESLEPEQQVVLRSEGVEKFNQVLQEEQQRFERKHVRLDDGSYVAKGDWIGLTPQEREAVMAEGTDVLSLEELSPQERYARLQSFGRIEEDTVFAGVDKDTGELLIRNMLPSEAEIKMLQDKIDRGERLPPGYYQDFRDMPATGRMGGYRPIQLDPEAEGKTAGERSKTKIYSTKTNPDAVQTPAEIAMGLVEFGVVGVYVARNWGNLSNKSKAINIILDAALIGAFFARPIAGAIRTSTVTLKNASTTGFKLILREATNLNRAIQAKDVTRIRTAGTRLETLGAQMEAAKIEGGTMVRRYGATIRADAKNIAAGVANQPKVKFIRQKAGDLTRSLLPEDIGPSLQAGVPLPRRLPTPAQRPTPTIPKPKDHATELTLGRDKVQEIWERTSREGGGEALYNRRLDRAARLEESFRQIEKDFGQRQAVRAGELARTERAVKRYRPQEAPEPAKAPGRISREANLKGLEDWAENLKRMDSPASKELLKQTQKKIDVLRREISIAGRLRGGERTPSVEVLQRLTTLVRKARPQIEDIAKNFLPARTGIIITEVVTKAVADSMGKSITDAAQKAYADTYTKAKAAGATEAQAQAQGLTAARAAAAGASQSSSTMMQAQADAETAVANATANSALAEVLAETAVEATVSNMTETEAEAIAESAVETVVAIEPVAVVALAPAVAPAEKVEVTERILRLPVARVRIDRPVAEPEKAVKIKVPKALPFIPGDEREEVATREEEFPAGTITWRQGELHGKDEWKILRPPYTEVERMDHAPKGAKNVDEEGEGSAFRTVQVIGGSPPEDVDIDLGWADIHIDTSGFEPVISFKADGELTDVGKSKGSSTKGVSVDVTEEPRPPARERVRTLAQETQNSVPLRAKEGKLDFTGGIKRNVKPKMIQITGRTYRGRELPDRYLGSSF